MSIIHTNTNKNHKLVIDFEYDDLLKQEHLMLHVKNLLNDFDESSILVEVVAYGPAIRMLTKDYNKFKQEIIDLQNRGVIFHACHNAMEMFAIHENDLSPNVTPVPSGVGYIIKKQFDGYAYFKA